MPRRRPSPRRPPSCCSSATGRRRPPGKRAARPGRRACTWPTTGRRQAEAVAERIAALDAQGRRRLRLAARAHPGDGGAHRQGARACGCAVERGLLECDFGDWTGRRAEGSCCKLPEWQHGAALPERLPLPGRRVVRRDADPHRRRRRPPARRPPGRDRRRRLPRRPHQGGGGRTPWAPTSTCSSASSSRRARSPRSPTATTARSCSPSTPIGRPRRRWRRHERRRSTSPTSTLHGRAPSGRPASASSTSRRATAASVVTLQLEKQQVAALADYLAGLLADLPAARRRGHRRPRASSSRSSAEWVVGADRRRLRRATRPHRRACSRSCVDEEDERRRRGRRDGAVRARPAAQVAAFVGHARASWSPPAGRRARSAASPLDPDGHVCPRMNGHRTPTLPTLLLPTARSRSRAACRGARTPPSSSSCASTATTALGRLQAGRGERPLWDFPPGLYRREVAAYELSEALGWDLVPETVIARRPAGRGLGPAVRRRRLRAALLHAATRTSAHHDALRAICAFDLLANNTDRKSGHCLLGEDGRIWAIDHGLCFHAEPKLRTVIWEFGGEPVPDELLADVGAARRRRRRSRRSRAARRRRARRAARARPPRSCAGRCFPQTRSGRAYPWPLV